MERRGHWNSVYERKPPDQVSWYRPHLEQSLRFIDAAGLGRDAAILDVGGGASTLVDDLLARGYSNVSVLDISEKAIAAARARLGARAAEVRWLTADITAAELAPGAYDFWHDRAVFHFLVDEADRRRYVSTAARALRAGGHLLIATFGPEGPTKCSGLEVVRYSPDELYAQLGPGFELLDSATEVHATPWGAEQPFVACYCRRR
jgi:SAM-dependent methyltransferase